MNKTFYKYAIFLAILILVCLSVYFFLKRNNTESFETGVHIANEQEFQNHEQDD